MLQMDCIELQRAQMARKLGAEAVAAQKVSNREAKVDDRDAEVFASCSKRSGHAVNRGAHHIDAPAGKLVCKFKPDDLGTAGAE